MLWAVKLIMLHARDSSGGMLLTAGGDPWLGYRPLERARRAAPRVEVFSLKVANAVDGDVV
jgi:hypothetical protein